MNYPTNNTDVYHIDELWSSHIIDIKDCGVEKNRGYRYVLVVINNLSNFGWTICLKNKKAQSIKEALEILMKSSRRKTHKVETDEESKLVNKLFTNLLNNKNVRRFSRNTSVGVVFAEKPNRTIRDLLNKPVFEKGEINWIDVLPIITKQYINRVHTSTESTPIQASLKKNERFVYQNFLDKRRQVKPKYKIGDLLKTADLQKRLSKCDTTNWSYKL